MTTTFAPSNIGIPYGVVPMLIIIYLCTQVKLSKRSEVFLGASQNKFLAKLGKRATGGKNGSLKNVKRQMKSLFSSSIKILESDQSSWNVNSINLVKNAELIWQPKDKNKWEAYLNLDTVFVSSAINSAVPVDKRVLAALAHYPLAFATYIWLTSRLFRLEHPIRITWKELEEQFGCDYKRRSHFKFKFKKSLSVVTLFYPDANFKIGDEYLYLYRSKPHVPQRKRK